MATRAPIILMWSSITASGSFYVTIATWAVVVSAQVRATWGMVSAQAGGWQFFSLSWSGRHSEIVRVQSITFALILIIYYIVTIFCHSTYTACETGPASTPAGCPCSTKHGVSQQAQSCLISPAPSRCIPWLPFELPSSS